MSHSFFLSLLIVTFLSNFIHGAEFSQCNNQLVGSFIAVTNNCSKAIYCNGVNSAIVDCDNNNPYFSPKDEKCHDETSVCGSRPFILVNIPTTTSAIPTIVTSKPITSTNFQSFVTRNTTLSSLPASTATATTEQLITKLTFGSSTSPTTLTTNPSETKATESTPHSSTFTVSLPAVLTTSNNNMTTENPTILNQCPGTDDPRKPLFLPHPKSCSQYILCYHGVATVMECPNMLHFDVTHKSCNTADRAKCQVIYKVNSVIPREKCLNHIVDLYPHPTKCNYYYLCEYGFLMVMQCPFEMGWDYERRACTMRSRAKCYKGGAVRIY